MKSRLVIVLLLHIFKVASARQEWIEKPKDVMVKEGKDAVLACKVRNKVGRCFWRKNSRLIYLYPGKYEWEGNPAAGDCSLRIKTSSQQFDTGDWQCSVSATTYQGRVYFRDTLDSDPVQLLIQVAPSYAVIKKSGDVSGNIVGLAGQTLQIECLAYGGFPIPSIVWHLGDVQQPLSRAAQDTYKDQDTGEIITRSTLELEIQTEDNGKQLSCEVVNEAQSLPLWVKAMLNIGFPPNVTVTSSASGPVVEGEDSVSLTCQAESNPESELAWRKEGNRRVLSSSPVLDLGVVSRTDIGTYTCTATNQLGSSPGSIDVVTHYSPNVTVVSSSSVPLREDQDSVTLTCSADSNPPPTYVWVRKNQEGEIGRGPVLNINPVDRTHVDTYSCIASNSLGTSKPKSVDVDVYYLPNVTMTASQTTLTEGRDTLNLNCEVDSNPPATIKWFKNLETENFEEVGSGTELIISPINRHNAGTYTCIATNIIGESPRTQRDALSRSSERMRRSLFIDVQYLPTVIIEPDVANLQYTDSDAELTVECEVTDANPPAEITWIKVGNTAVYSTRGVITVGTKNTGEFLCTALNSVGPSLTASIKVSVKDFPRRLQIEANDYRSSVRLHFPL